MKARKGSDVDVESENAYLQQPIEEQPLLIIFSF